MKLIFEKFDPSVRYLNDPQIYDKPIFGALRALARKYGLTVEQRPAAWWENIPAENEPQLVFWPIAEHDDWAKYRRYKERCPNGKLVTFGSDTLYYGDLRRFDWSAIDLHLDCTMQAVRAVTLRGVTCERFFWSISQETIDEIAGLCPQPEHVERDIDALGVYRSNRYRSWLFDALRCLGSRTLLGPNDWDFARTIGLYSRSWVAVGTTSGVIVDGCARSMKGYRDWLAPFAGCVLTYDDYPDCMEVWSGVVPLYRYGDYLGLQAIIDNVCADREGRLDLLARQRQWALNNTTDRQLERLFLRHGLLSDG